MPLLNGPGSLMTFNTVEIDRTCSRLSTRRYKDGCRASGSTVCGSKCLPRVAELRNNASLNAV